MNEQELLNQLDAWIEQCRVQAEVFTAMNMEVSAISSEAMGQAYKNVKTIILEKSLE